MQNCSIWREIACIKIGDLHVENVTAVETRHDT